MKKKETEIFWICIILTMGLAIASFVISLPRTIGIDNNIYFDYQGLLVNVLAILVTVLVGWQIYSAFRIESRITKFGIKLNFLSAKLEKTENNIKSVSQASEKLNLGIQYMLLAIVEYYKLENAKEETAKCKCELSCKTYIFAVRAIKFLLESKKGDDVVMPMIKTCTLAMGSSLDTLENEKIDAVESTLLIKMNQRCDEAYSAVAILGGDLLTQIEKLRAKRKILLST